MKTIILAIIFFLFVSSAFSQSAPSKNIINIDVPDFAQSDVKAFYTEYSANLIKIIRAIREKDEDNAVALLKNPGKQLNDKRKIIEKKVIMNPVEKQKWMQYATQVYPLIKELERSPYYQKLSGGK